MPRPWTGRRIVSIATLKGGVGKSTTAMMIADALSLFHRVRVVLVDLDPQASLSRMILSFRGMQHCDASGKTLTRWVERTTNNDNGDLFSILEPNATGLKEVRDAAALNVSRPSGSLGIIPATPALWFAERAFDHANFDQADPDAPRKRMAARLCDGLNSLGQGCDLVIFDCPPGFTTLAQAALSLSDAIVSPMFEEQLSLWSLRTFRDFGMTQTLNAWVPERHRVLFTRVTSQGAERERTQLRSDVRAARFQPLDAFIRYAAAQAHRWVGRSAPDSFIDFKSKYKPVDQSVQKLGSEVVAFIQNLPPLEEN